ncbi:MAG: PaaI family thioesterase [bacterium]|nr:PaaI family thioesterase [bacterium]MDT8367226.1 PaaI family thioesterase [bacterium]
MDQLLFSGCFVCGPDNECGLKSTFQTLDTGEVEGMFTPGVKHSGYEGVVHGGVIMGFLDEVLGRLAFNRDRLFLTHTLEVTFRKAASPGKRLKAVAQEEEWSKRKFKASGMVTDEDGDIVATARGTFLVMSEKMEKGLLPEGRRMKDEG